MATAIAAGIAAEAAGESIGAAIFGWATTALFMGGAVIGLARTGINNIEKTDQVKQQIKDINSLNNNLQAQFDKINIKQAELDFQVKQDITNTITGFSNQRQKLAVTLDQMNKSLRTTEMVGVIIVVIIFFLLLLKNFDLLKPLIEFLSLPITFIYNKLTNI